MKLVLIFLNFLFIFPALSQGEKYLIKDVIVNCDRESTCELLQPRFFPLKGEEHDITSLNFELKTRLFEELIDSFEFKLLEKNNEYTLDIAITTRKIIKSIQITSSIKGINLDGLQALLPFQEGDFYNSNLNYEAEVVISRHLLDIGVLNPAIELKVIPRKDDIKMEIFISSSSILRVKKVKMYFREKRNIEVIKNKILRLGGKPFNRKEVNQMTDEISKEIFQEGYPYSFLKLRPVNISKENKDITLEFDLRLGKKINFSISGNSLISRDVLLNLIKNKIKDQPFLSEKQEMALISTEIIEAYKEQGFYNTLVKIHAIEGFNAQSEEVKSYFIKVQEGRKIKVGDLFFSGNRFFTDEQIRKIYYEKGTSLSRNNYLDVAYLERFKEEIYSEYLRNGFVQSEISSPKIDFAGKSKMALISFKIKEYKPTILEAIEFSPGIKELFGDEILNVFLNKIQKPLNILQLNDDVEALESFLKQKGYFFSKVKNKESDNIISYNLYLSKAKLYFDIELGKKSFFNKFYVSGNLKTEEEVFERESPFIKGDLLTWDKLNSFIDRISNTGLFGQVKVLPRPVENISYGDNSQLVDLVIEVKERDFANLELGPGFRTDLGLRLTSKFRFINVSGMGRRLSFRAELNQRLSEESAFAPVRQGQYPLAFLEYFLDAKYEEPYLGGIPVGMDITGAVGRRRYRTFDSNILLTGITFSETSSWFSPLIRYQFESDYQYNAAYEKDEGLFKIGSIAPSLSFDFRDRKVTPRKGAFFSILGEYASPALGAIETSNYKINFFSIISRNNFYVPFAHNWVGAFYLSLGYQKNLATEIITGSDGQPTTLGYIPTVKVFRLEGSDSVRGYRNSEINILSNGEDIAQVTVDDTAYYLNFKLEARHYLNDSFVLFPFFDGGSIQVDKWEPFQLKTTVGVGLKYLTPMGSLEIDFGIKTHRAVVNGSRETFGAIELMIGYF